MIENIRLSLKGIWSHKMRSALTMLGIIIGIAAIITIVSTIEGTQEQIKENLIGSGNNNVKIDLYKGDSGYEAEYTDDSVAPVITEEQKAEVKSLDHVVNASFYYSRNYASNVYYNNKAFTGGFVYGIDSCYLDTCGYKVRDGRVFTEKDYTGFQKKAVIDTNAARNIFEDESAVGKVIEIGKEPYTIIGVVEKKIMFPKVETVSEFNSYYQPTMGGIMIPYTSWPLSFKFDEPMNAVIKTDSADHMSSAGKEAENILNSSLTREQNDFSYRADDVMERVRSLQQLSESTNQQLIGIALISLLVGGIGVMNIMLVSVTERTKEIGLKKAIGARKSSIRAQFLTESAMITLFGGVIGVIVGILASRFMSRVTGTPFAINVLWIVISVLVSTGIGIFFGFWPSSKAAKLNPIDALRTD